MVSLLKHCVNVNNDNIFFVDKPLLCLGLYFVRFCAYLLLERKIFSMNHQSDIFANLKCEIKVLFSKIIVISLTVGNS